MRFRVSMLMGMLVGLAGGVRWGGAGFAPVGVVGDNRASPFRKGPAMAELRDDVTQVLEQMSQGDKRAADKLLPLVYDEFRALARHYLAQERMNHTLQP